MNDTPAARSGNTKDGETTKVVADDFLFGDALRLSRECVAECGPAAQTAAAVQALGEPCFWSIETIAAAAMLKPATVKKHIRGTRNSNDHGRFSLIKTGWLIDGGRQPMPSGRKRRTVTYTLCDRLRSIGNDYWILPRWLVGICPTWSQCLWHAFVLSRLRAQLKSSGEFTPELSVSWATIRKELSMARRDLFRSITETVLCHRETANGITVTVRDRVSILVPPTIASIKKRSVESGTRVVESGTRIEVCITEALKLELKHVNMRSLSLRGGVTKMKARKIEEPDPDRHGRHHTKLMNALRDPRGAELVDQVAYLVAAGEISEHHAYDAANGPRAVGGVWNPVGYFRDSLEKNVPHLNELLGAIWDRRKWRSRLPSPKSCIDPSSPFALAFKAHCLPADEDQEIARLRLQVTLDQIAKGST